MGKVKKRYSLKKQVTPADKETNLSMKLSKKDTPDLN